MILTVCHTAHKKTWDGINNQINSKKPNKSIHRIKCPQTQGLSQDPLEQANILNVHFATVGHRIASNMPIVISDFQNIYQQSAIMVLFFSNQS